MSKWTNPLGVRIGRDIHGNLRLEGDVDLAHILVERDGEMSQKEAEAGGYVAFADAELKARGAAEKAGRANPAPPANEGAAAIVVPGDEPGTQVTLAEPESAAADEGKRKR